MKHGTMRFITNFVSPSFQHHKRKVRKLLKYRRKDHWKLQA